MRSVSFNGPNPSPTFVSSRPSRMPSVSPAAKFRNVTLNTNKTNALPLRTRITRAVNGISYDEKFTFITYYRKRLRFLGAGSDPGRSGLIRPNARLYSRTWSTRRNCRNVSNSFPSLQTISCVSVEIISSTPIEVFNFIENPKRHDTATRGYSFRWLL